MQTPVHCHTKLVLSSLRDIQPMELVVWYCLQSTIKFPSVTNNSGVQHGQIDLIESVGEWVADWIGDYLVALPLVRRYLRKYNRSEIETFYVGVQ